MNSNACCASREAEIPHETNRLAQNIERLAKTVEELSVRMQSTLRAEPIVPTPEKLGTKSSSPSASLAVGLNDANNKLSSLTDRISDLINRCELGG